MTLLGMNELEKLTARLFDPKSRIAFMIDADSFNAFKHNFPEVPGILEEKLKFLKGVGTWKNNHAFWLVEETMQKLISAGIPQWYRKYIFEVLLRDARHEESESKVFGFEDLEFEFVIWGVACLMTIFVFFMELVWFYAREYVGLYVVMRGFELIQFNV